MYEKRSGTLGAIGVFCKIGDKLAGKLLRLAYENTIVVVTSDHGAVPATHR